MGFLNTWFNKDMNKDWLEFKGYEKYWYDYMISGIKSKNYKEKFIEVGIFLIGIWFPKKNITQVLNFYIS